MKKYISTLLFCMVLVSQIGAASAVSETDIADITEMQKIDVNLQEIVDYDFDSYSRAINRIEWTISPGRINRGKPALSLEAGETVTINCSFSPRNADVDFGLIDSDGYFYFDQGADGSFRQTICIEESGKYYFATRNNSNSTVEVLGYIYY